MVQPLNLHRRGNGVRSIEELIADISGPQRKPGAVVLPESTDFCPVCPET
jgi:hypothetical protein